MSPKIDTNMMELLVLLH